MTFHPVSSAVGIGSLTMRWVLLTNLYSYLSTGKLLGALCSFPWELQHRKFTLNHCFLLVFIERGGPSTKASRRYYSFFTFFLAMAPWVNWSREECGEEAAMVLYHMSQAERKSQPKIYRFKRLNLLNSCCLEMVEKFVKVWLLFFQRCFPM